MPARYWTFLTGALVVASAHPARADGQVLRASSLSWVRWPGAEACPGPIAIARKVEKRLGRTVFVAPSRAELAVEAYAERVPGPGWHVVISLSREDGSVVGHRELSSQEEPCSSVAEEAALAIALMIDPDAMEGPDRPAEAPAGEPVVPPPVAQPPSTSSSAKAVAAAPPLLPWRAAIEVATGIGAGLLPALSPGVFVRGRAIEPTRTLGLEVEGAYFFEQQAELRPGVGAELALFYAGISLCALPWAARRVSALLCAGGEAGSIAVRGYGFLESSPASQNTVVNLAGRARLSFRLEEHWAVLLGGNLWVPLRRDHFEARSGGVVTELYRLSPVAGGFEIGLAYEF